MQDYTKQLNGKNNLSIVLSQKDISELKQIIWDITQRLKNISTAKSYILKLDRIKRKLNKAKKCSL